MKKLQMQVITETMKNRGEAGSADMWRSMRGCKMTRGIVYGNEYV